MAYEPLNLQNGQVLTAEDVQHIEQGVQNVLPQNPGAYQYPATDGSGNMVWADRLAYTEDNWNIKFVYDENNANNVVASNGTKYYYVSDHVCTPAQLVEDIDYSYIGYNGETIVSGVSYRSEEDPSLTESVFSADGESTLCELRAFFATSENQEYKYYSYGEISVTFTKPGVYATLEVVNDITHKFLNVEPSGRTIQTIDPKYLPTGTVIAGKNVGHEYKQLVTDYYGNVKWEDRLTYDTTQYTLIQQGDVGAGPVAGANPPYGNNNGTLLASSIVVGDEYMVYVDGARYSAVAQETDNEAGSQYPGVMLFGPYNDFSVAPVNLYAYGDVIYVNYQEENNHWLEIEHIVVAPKPIDPKFLPPIESNVFIIAQNDGYNGTDKTWEEIVAAYNSGSAIFLRSGKTTDPEFPQVPMLMPLAYINTSSDDGEATFCGMFYDGTDFRACRTVVRSDGTLGGNQKKITTTAV